MMPDFQPFLQGPASEPPPGITPDFLDSRGLVQANVFAAVFCAITAVFLVGLRLFNNVFLHKEIRSDDWVLLLGLSTYIAYCAVAAVLVDHGILRHEWNIRLIEMQPILYWVRVSSCIYGVCVALVKSSICLQYIYIFSPGERNSVFWSCWSLIVFLVLFYGAVLFAEIFACSPVSKYWTPWMEGGHCINHLAMNVAAGAANSIADIVLIILPQKSIWQLNMDLERKWKVSAIFLVAFIALVASVIRLYYAVEVMHSSDKTTSFVLMGRWTFVEFFTTFVCSCMPALSHLYRHYRPTGGYLASKSSRRNLLPETDVPARGVKSGGDDDKSQCSVRESSITDARTEEGRSRCASRMSGEKRVAEIAIAY